METKILIMINMNLLNKIIQMKKIMKTNNRIFKMKKKNFDYLILIIKLLIFLSLIFIF